MATKMKKDKVVWEIRTVKDMIMGDIFWQITTTENHLTGEDTKTLFHTTKSYQSHSKARTGAIAFAKIALKSGSYKIIEGR